jgi:4-hydroxyphenylacetate 3-monooxygenase
MCRAQFHDTPSHIFQNYQAQIRLSVKMKFLVGLAHKITETIGTTNMPQVREQLGTLAANAGMVEGMLSGMEASGSKRGEFYLPSRHLLYAAQVVTQDLYPRLINLIRDLGGGALICVNRSRLGQPRYRADSA